MRDLADDLRDYFDALADAEPPANADAVAEPQRRRYVTVAVAVAVVAVVAALVVVTRPERRHAPVTSPPPTTAVTEKDGLRLTLRLVATAPAYTVEATIENVGAAPIRMGGQLAPANACERFPVGVEAVRTAWVPGDQPWPGADHYLGPIQGGGWSNVESRGSAFTDPLVAEMQRATQDRLGYVACDLPLRVGSLMPGERGARTFTWAPPAGWPGGHHDLVTSYFLGYSDNEGRHPLLLTARIPVDVRSDVADAMGPADALERLAHDPAFQAETTARGGLMGVTSTWSPARWLVSVQWMDSNLAFWTIDPQGAVARSDVYPRP
jgi:hypothetical protein